MSVSAWSSSHPDGCVDCGGTDRAHAGEGRCNRCYARARRSRHRKESAELGIWDPLHPDGCVSCGRTDRVHVSGGRCSSCYAPSTARAPLATPAASAHDFEEAERLLHPGALSREALNELSPRTLLATYRALLAELRERGIVRTENAPAGDYAEYLVAKYLGGTLASNSEKSFDVLDPAGQRIQVKSRVLSGGAGPRQLSAIRSWAFDLAAIVLFATDFSIHRAVMMPVQAMEDKGIHIGHVNAAMVNASDSFLASGTDFTVELQELADRD